MARAEPSSSTPRRDGRDARRVVIAVANGNVVVGLGERSETDMRRSMEVVNSLRPRSDSQSKGCPSMYAQIQTLSVKRRLVSDGRIPWHSCETQPRELWQRFTTVTCDCTNGARSALARSQGLVKVYPVRELQILLRHSHRQCWSRGDKYNRPRRTNRYWNRPST
jgi:hypothetical protein